MNANNSLPAAGKEPLLDLAVVMPVYNEAGCISEVVRSWCEALKALDIRFQLIVINDGSRDETGRILDGLANANVHVIHKPNSGHGPTVLVGYRYAAAIATWVFQVDSDNELTPLDFASLWNRRAEYPAMIGYRVNRHQPLGRRLISAVSRSTIRICFGPGVRDVNTPYRLLRAELLRDIIASMPDDTFAPNILVSGWLAWQRVPVLNLPVRHENRRTGTVSIVRWRLWRAAFRAFRQTVAWRHLLASRPGANGKAGAA